MQSPCGTAVMPCSLSWVNRQEVRERICSLSGQGGPDTAGPHGPSQRLIFFLSVKGSHWGLVSCV